MASLCLTCALLALPSRDPGTVLRSSPSSSRRASAPSLLLSIRSQPQARGRLRSALACVDTVTASTKTTMSFRKDDPPEVAVPTVSLTKSRDGTTGTATFRFDSASVLEFDNVWENGLLTGLWLRDEEGELHTTDLNVVFERGRPVQMVAILVLKSVGEWQRFLRFMERYAVANELEFESAGSAAAAGGESAVSSSPRASANGRAADG